MKFSVPAAIASALVLGAAQPAVADLHAGHRAAHHHYGRRSVHSHGEAALLRERQRQPQAASSSPEASKRQPQTIDNLPALLSRDAPLRSPRRRAAATTAEGGGDVTKRAVCQLPDDSDLVAVPGASNGGWAMAPDVQCTAGSWCPIACASGKVMAQWKPGTTYVYPESMDGGLYCGSDGTPVKGFPDKPYCVDGTGTVSAVNTCGSVVSFCQTVLPGDEGMYIPTDVHDSATLAVPGPSYWDGTAAHYYVNPPGTSGAEGCVWGTSSSMVGNWSPYVAGANTDSNGQTFLKLGWNPVYTASGLTSTKPTFGLRIECDGDNCNGLPCEIGADNAADFSVKSSESASGAGGADFCVATVPSGGSARIVVFNFDGSSSSTSSGGGGGSGSSSSSSNKASSGTTTTSSSTTSSSTTTSSSSTSTTSSTTSSTKSSTTSSSSSSTSTSTSSSWLSSSDDSSSASQTGPYGTGHKTKTATKAGPTTLAGGIFHENGTASASESAAGGTAAPTASVPGGGSSSTKGSAAASASSKSEAVTHHQGGAAVVGLIVAVVAGLWLY